LKTLKLFNFNIKGKKSLWMLLGVAYLIVFILIGCFQMAEVKNLHTERSLGGNELYQTYCLRCHGDKGQARGAVPALNLTKLNLDQFALKLQSGGKGMPVFKQALFDSDYLPLFQYVQALK